jgi:hypothetical protein
MRHLCALIAILFLILLLLGCGAVRPFRAQDEPTELYAIGVKYISRVSIKRVDEGNNYREIFFYLYEDKDHLIYRVPNDLGPASVIYVNK